MKRNVFLLLLLGSFLMVPNNAEAQFLKKLGSAIKKELGLEKKNGNSNESEMQSLGDVVKKKTVSKEVEELLKKAEQGDAESMYSLGLHYANGNGVEQSYAEANKWYRKGAELGNGKAAYGLGYNYDEGNGVEQSYAEANKWYRKGAELGNGSAACNLGYYYEKGNGVEQSYTEAFKWYRKGAELGNGIAASNLGLLYKYGNGITKDITEANKWFRKAVELGYEKAKDYIEAYDPIIEEAKKLTQGGNYIIGNYKVTKPITGLTNMGGSSVQTDPAIFKATLEQISFGNEGNTVLITIEGKEDGKVISHSYCWSGPSVKVAPSYEGGMPTLSILRGTRVGTACGGLCISEGKGIVVLNTATNAYTISSFHKGMMRSEVENLIKKEFGLSQFKFTRNSGNLKVYSFYWLDQAKRYNFFGDYHYELRNDKKYGDFYFDASGKLVKWLLYM